MVDRYAKAIVAGLGAAYAVYQVAIGDLSPAGGLITQQEWVAIAVTGLFVGGVTWAVPNASAQVPTAPRHERPDGDG